MAKPSFRRKLFKLPESRYFIEDEIKEFVNNILEIHEYSSNTAKEINEYKYDIAVNVIEFIIECYCIFIYEKIDDDGEYDKCLNELISDGIIDINNNVVNSIYYFAKLLNDKYSNLHKYFTDDFLDYVNNILGLIEDYLISALNNRVLFIRISVDTFENINNISGNYDNLFSFIFDNMCINLSDHISFPDLTNNLLNFNKLSDIDLPSQCRNIYIELDDLKITFDIYDPLDYTAGCYEIDGSSGYTRLIQISYTVSDITN